MGAPEEPWVDTLKTIMLVFGIALLACFVMPWSLGDKTLFSWDIIRTQQSTQKLLPLLIGGSGLLAVILSLLPLTVSARGVAAAFLGIVPLGLLYFLLGENMPMQSVFLWFAEDIEWQSMVAFIAALTLIAGLLLRSQYHSTLTARVMVTIAVVCILMLNLVPQGGEIPLIAKLKAIGTAAGKAKILPIVDLVWLLFVVLSLLSWLPAPGAAGSKILAWVFITLPLINTLIVTLLKIPTSELGSQIKGAFAVFILFPITLMAWNALLGYGVASVAGKSLEHSEG